MAEATFVAEDLGLIDEPVEALRDDFFEGHRVLQFGFDGDPSNTLFIM